jgi:type IV pilus assembly protein PilW
MQPLRTFPRRQQGFTLVELMVAVTIGLLLLGSLSALFVNNNHAQL